MEHLIFILFSAAGIAAFVSAPINPFKSRGAAKRGEIILLNDLHRTTFRRY